MDGKPPYEVADAQPLTVLPDPNKGDLFFDFEGDPLWTADGRGMGPGVSVRACSTAADGFQPLWAHDRAERAPGAASTSSRWCANAASATRTCTSTTTRPTRRRRCCGWPAGTASARTTSTTCCATASWSTCIRWCARAFGSAPRTTASSRSSRCTWARSCARGEVTTADRLDHPVRALLRAARRRPRPTRRRCVLKEIEDYNRYDCRSTRKLRDWLTGARHRIRCPPVGPQPVARRRRDRGRRRPRARKLLQVRRRRASSARTAEQTAVAMVAAARGLPPPRGQAVLVGATSTGSTIPSTNGPTTPTCSSPTTPRSSPTGTSRRRRRKPQRRVRLTERSRTASSTQDMYALYDPPAPAGPHRRPGPARVRHASRSSRCDDPERADRGDRLSSEQPKDGGRVRPGAVRADAGAADHDQAAAGVHRQRPPPTSPRACPSCPPSAVIDILLRRPPRTRSGGALPGTGVDRRSTSPRRCSTWTRRTSRCTGRPAPARRSPRRHVIARLVNEHRMAHRRGRAVARGRGEPVRAM